MYELIIANALQEIQTRPLVSARGDNKRNYLKGAQNSIANQPHEHKREIARRLHQAQRKEVSMSNGG